MAAICPHCDSIIGRLNLTYVIGSFLKVTLNGISALRTSA